MGGFAVESSPEGISREDGLRLLKAGQLDEAIDVLKKVAEQAPDDAQAHCYLGVAYNQKGDRLHAIASFEQSLRLDESAKAYFNLGLIYEQAHRIDEAVREYKMAAEMDPNYTPAREAIKRLHDQFESARAQRQSPDDTAVAPSAQVPQTPASQGPPDYRVMQIEKEQKIAEAHRTLIKSGLIYGIICGAVFIIALSFAGGMLSLMPAMLIARFGILNYLLIIGGGGAVFGGLIGLWVGMTNGGESEGMQAGAALGAVAGLAIGLIGGVGVAALIYMIVVAIPSGIVGMFIGRMVEASIGQV